MKSLKKLTQEYVEKVYGAMWDDPMYAPDVAEAKSAFKAGFSSKKEIESKQLEQIRDLEIVQKDYHESVDELIHRYVATSAGCEYGEFERFKQELERLKKPTN